MIFLRRACFLPKLINGNATFRMFSRTIIDIEDFNKFQEQKKLLRGMSPEEIEQYKQDQKELLQKENEDLLKKVILDEWMYEASFARSSGPGGQNVNKVESKAVIKINLENLRAIHKDLPEKLLHDIPNRINKNNELVLSSETHRDQKRNLSEVIRKAEGLIKDSIVQEASREIFFVDETETKKSHRINYKKRRSDIKSTRRMGKSSDF